MLKNTKNHDDDALFRQEVFDAKNNERLGTISLVPKTSFLVVGLIAIVITLTVLAILFLGSYTRRISVGGQLLPVSGLIRVISPQTGIVLEKHVEEGQQVKKGDLLYVISSDRVGASAVDMQAQILQQISNRIRSLENEINRNKQSEQSELSQLEQRLKYLTYETTSIENQLRLQNNRMNISRDNYMRYKELGDKDYVANEQVIEKELDLSEQETRLQTLQRDLAALQKEKANTQRDINDLHSRFANLNSQLERNILAAKQESTEVESRSSVFISAPQQGTATLVTAKLGQTVDSNTQLMSIIPSDSKLEARLYAPSSAIGFIRQGNRVLLRYQSYPYQKFGLYEGTVESISSASVSIDELSAVNASVGSALTTSTEPVYSITIALKQQHVMAYGVKESLQSGMRLEADIMQEERKLYEWILEPLYSVTGRIR